MSDLGSKAALQADIDAKVTTNGNGENTGARVRAALTNMVDTLSNGENLSVTPYLYLTSGSQTGIYRYQFMNEGKRCYVLLGSTATPENLFNCVVWADPGNGLKWNVTDEIGEVLYTSASDVATPDLATGWTLDQGTGPLPSIAGYPGPTVQDVLEQIAARVPTKSLRYFSGAIVGSEGVASFDLSAEVTGSAQFVSALSTEGEYAVATQLTSTLNDYQIGFKTLDGEPLPEEYSVWLWVYA